MALPYASYPDIVEDILRLSGRATLLAARGTCSSLRAFVDRVLCGETLFFRAAGGDVVVSSRKGAWEPDLPPLRDWSSLRDSRGELRSDGRDRSGRSPARTPTPTRSPNRRDTSRPRSRRRSPSPWRYVPANPAATPECRPGSPAAPDEERLPCFHPLGSAEARSRAVSRAQVVVLVDVPPSPGLDRALASLKETTHIAILHAQHAPAPAYNIPKVKRLTMSVTPNCLCGTRLGIREVGRKWARRAPPQPGPVPGAEVAAGRGAKEKLEKQPWWSDDGRSAGNGLNDGGGVVPELRHRAASVHVRLTRLIADPILARASYSQLCAGLSGALSAETTALVLEQQGVMPEPFWNPACLVPLPSPSSSIPPSLPSALSPSSPAFPLDPTSRLEPKPALALQHVEVLARALPDFEVRSLVERLRARMRRTASQTEDHAELRRRFAVYFGLPLDRVRARELPRCEWKRLHGQPAEPGGRCGHCAPLPAGLEGVLV